MSLKIFGEEYKLWGSYYAISVSSSKLVTWLLNEVSG